MSTDCINTDHFSADGGVLAPQPWMQYRHLGGVSGLSRSSEYTPSGGGFLQGIPFFGGSQGGGNKNELIHSLQFSWTNSSPIDQWVYGMITRGGCRVTLQARSRAYLEVWSGYAIGASAGDLERSSATGCGADLGRGGSLSVGTGFCIIEERQNSLTIPVAPERPGWQRVTPGQMFTAAVEVRFKSDVWEGAVIDGGSTETESGFTSGFTRLDLFAVPVIE